MEVHAVTTCVHADYAARLAKALPVWLDTLDSLTIVTVPGDPAEEFHGDNLRVVVTRAFYETTVPFETAHFNKGKALNVGLSFMDQSDWLLSFDADIIPPKNWRSYAEERAEVDCLHGCRRAYKPGAKFVRHSRFTPIGYFQLWHASDPVAQDRPLFSEWHDNASAYDMDFCERWHKERWRLLGFTCYHDGNSRRNWYGVGNDELMREHLRTNMRRARRIAAREIANKRVTK